MSQIQIKKLEEWAEGKPAYLVLLAMQVMPMAAMLADFIAMLGERHQLHAVLPKPQPDLWRTFYRKHRTWQRGVCKSMDIDSEALVILDELRRMGRRAKTDPDALREEIIESFTELGPEQTAELMQEARTASSAELEESYREAIEPEHLSEEEEEQVGRGMQTQEAGFLVRVWLPCWVLHKTTPWHLYRKAMRGSTDAIEILLRIDKTRLADPAIMRHVVDSAYGPVRGHYKRLTDAIAGQPRGKMTSGKLKRRLAAWIAQWSAEAGTPITAADLGRLYDILAARDGNLHDPEISPSPESFSKAVQREKNWPLADPDKNRT